MPGNSKTNAIQRHISSIQRLVRHEHGHARPHPRLHDQREARPPPQRRFVLTRSACSRHPRRINSADNVVDQDDPAYRRGSLEKAIALVAVVFVAEPSLGMKIFDGIDIGWRGGIADTAIAPYALQIIPTGDKLVVFAK